MLGFMENCECQCTAALTMTNKVYIVADTHFGHRKVIQFEAEKRPFSTIEEHDRELVARWNATVRQKDTVWHLGDVFFGGREAHSILGELNGIKRLVLGNHDVCVSLEQTGLKPVLLDEVLQTSNNKPTG